MIELDFTKLVNTIFNDEAQRVALEELAKHRMKLPLDGDDDVSATVLRYIKNGIHYVPDGYGDTYLEEIEYLAEESGSNLKGYGINENNSFFFKDKYIIPIRDSANKILFYVTHNYTNEKVAKYVNTYTDLFNGKEVFFKSYGMHNTQLALKQDRIVVTEGIFDCNALPEYNIPSIALLGTKIVEYHHIFLNRFNNIIYIPDNDVAGEMSWKNFKQKFPNAVKYTVPLGYKDVDQFLFEGKKNQVESWINELYILRNFDI